MYNVNLPLVICNIFCDLLHLRAIPIILMAAMLLPIDQLHVSNKLSELIILVGIVSPFLKW